MKPQTQKEKSNIKMQISKRHVFWRSGRSEDLNIGWNHRFATIGFIILLFSTYSFAAVESWKEFAVWPTTDDQELPDIYSDIVRI